MFQTLAIPFHGHSNLVDSFAIQQSNMIWMVLANVVFVFGQSYSSHPIVNLIPSLLVVGFSPHARGRRVFGLGLSIGRSLAEVRWF